MINYQGNDNLLVITKGHPFDKPAFFSMFIFLSIFLDEGAHGLLGAQGLAAACAMGAPDRLLSAWGIGATMAAASARVGRDWDNLRRE